jgi:hypothetical protein
MLFLRLLLHRRWILWRVLSAGTRIAMMRCCDDGDAEMLRPTYFYIVVIRRVWMEIIRISARV